MSNSINIKARCINIRQFKWGRFIIFETPQYKFQATYADPLNTIGINDFVSITGNWKEAVIKDNTLLQGKEFAIDSLVRLVIGKAETISCEYNRIKENSIIFKTKSEFVKRFRLAMEDNAIEIHTPKLIKESSEGGTDVFSVNYFDTKRYLAQSPQLYKQMMCNALMSNVYEIGNVYRAEKHHTSRHLNEYTSLDCEFVMNSLNVQELIDKCTNIIGYLIDYHYIPTQLTVQEAATKLGIETNDLSNQQELDLYNLLEDDIIVLTHFDNSIRAFYTYKDQSLDILYKGVEIVSGSIRKYEYNDYIKVMNERGMNTDNFKEYLNIFEQGAVYHGGFAIGLERLVKQYLGLSNINECIINQ